MNARISENLEKRQKGEQFRVLNPANLPTKPFKPDIFKLVLFGIASGIGAGGGAVYLREMMDDSFKKAQDVEDILRMPVLAAIPNLDEVARKGVTR